VKDRGERVARDAGGRRLVQDLEQPGRLNDAHLIAGAGDEGGTQGGRRVGDGERVAAGTRLDGEIAEGARGKDDRGRPGSLEAVGAERSREGCGVAAVVYHHVGARVFIPDRHAALDAGERPCGRIERVR
jgi:hypothetical protein